MIGCSNSVHLSVASALKRAAGAAALLALAAPSDLAAQPTADGAAIELPTVRVTTTRARPARPGGTPARGSARASRTRAPAAAPSADVAIAGPAVEGGLGAGAGTGSALPGLGGGQNARAGVVGYVTGRTTTATRTDTPLVNVPQSVNVITQEQIRDQAFGSVSDLVRFVPGVVPQQGEGNRDALTIRGQSTTADFFVDGVRDDAQYFRDLYNVSRVEVLKGPNAMIFGRGGGGGVINRVIKEADGLPVGEVILQGGQFNTKRSALDVGGRVTDTLAARFNALYENSGSFRNFVNVERYGLNPTVTYAPSANTRIKLSYEYFHDDRTADRGVPSWRDVPFPTSPSTFFGNPFLSYSKVDAHILTGLVEHETDTGVKIRNISRIADYDKFYQNVFPGAVNAAGTQVSLAAYNNRSDRTNLFNQTDIVSRFQTGWIGHTLLVGTELGRQVSDGYRETGYFNGTATNDLVSTLNPISLKPVIFRNNRTTDADGRSVANLAAVYAQDQIEVSRYLQFIGGIRLDRFDLDYRNNRTGITTSRVDDLVSPRTGVVVKPVDTLSLYGSYSVSYLPSAGDQFTTLDPTTAVLKPEKFTNKEVGVKWEALPNLLFTSAVYELDRENTRAADPNNPGFFVLTGATRTRGFEAGATGFITRDWQITGGYAYTDARIVRTTAAAPAGNRVPLVPTDTFSVWNKVQLTESWGAGAGVIYQTGMFAAVDNTVLLPGFTRFDAAVYGRVTPKLRWQINVENVLDTRYYATAHSNNNILPGSPRAIRGTLIASF